MTAVECDASPWLVQLQDALHCVGFAVVEDVLDAGFLATTRDRMYLVQGSGVVDLQACDLR
ncbi:hypothetical protein NJB1907f44_47340 [Mycobacterium marinum]|nr:hypothetical protein [Mycobacterium marinum]GJO01087.1 hypothetical protein NJB1907f34b_17310 [Mycobacterium marinum]GJO12001.1 hypothetical protein NJB1907E90_33270 [Mycobacterium marinum]GJO15564.1 hypothetical protein NJB1907E11_14530 [Mycobacterium marinum]GJO18049.1 hypothetical protein NJB1728e18_14200 [Mycobacterium marinum]GJO23651.1 hypothetical protein NJB1907f22_08290 [Mycobacterium marinum]